MRVERGGVLVPAVSPVPGQAGVVGGRRSLDHDVAADRRPGVLDQVGPGAFVAEDPPVAPGRAVTAVVPSRGPARGVVLRRMPSPYPGELPRGGCQRAEFLDGEHVPEVVRPDPNG